MNSKPAIRKALREKLAAMDAATRHSKSLAICTSVMASPEFAQAHVIMLYLSMPEEVDTAPLALRAWQAGKTVVVPKVSWDQRRMLPVEISTLNAAAMTTTGPGVREPIAGKPIPVDFIDLVFVPGLGFSRTGHRIGRGMGFYDRFLGAPEFAGCSCGLAFEEQIFDDLPVLDHDIPLSMLATEAGMKRFAASCIEPK
jgi:5-formyltetrahydrofolate cyclo-ligase